METKISVEEIEHYLSDLDNLIETGHFSRESVKDHTFYHKDMVLMEFVSKGREFIRQLSTLSPKSEESEQGKEPNLAWWNGKEWAVIIENGIAKLIPSPDQSKSTNK
jgi:hypothetical protein